MKNTINVSWPSLHAKLESHTVSLPVDQRRGGVSVVAGFFVRCTLSNMHVGWIWSQGDAFAWRTPDDANFGTRSTLRGAVEVLRDAQNLRSSGCAQQSPRRTLLDDLRDSIDERSATTATIRERASVVSAPVKPAAPAAPARRVVWNDSAPAFDVAAAIRAGLKVNR